MDPLQVRPETIEHYRQNKPSLIAADLEAAFSVPREASYAILMARGVFKWLAVRRDLIALKNLWRNEITRNLELLREAKRIGDRAAVGRLRGEIAALTRCRQQVRALCHSGRWRAPAFDGPACVWALSRGRLARLPGELQRLLRRKRETVEPAPPLDSEGEAGV